MKLIPVGRVVAVHGVRGEVTVRYYNDATTGTLRYPSFFVDRAGTSVELKPARIRQQGNIFIMKFMGLETVEAVSFLLKKELAVAESDLALLEEDEYYDYQLIGLRTVTDRGRDLGKVTGVMHIRGRDILVVQNGREVLVPMTDDHIVKIDREEGLVWVREESLVE